KAGNQRSNGGEVMPPVGRPKTKITPTDTVSRPHHTSSSEDMRRPWYQAAKGKVSIKDSTKMGWTINKVPKPSAISCRPYATTALAVPIHHKGLRMAVRMTERCAFSAILCRTTVPHAITRADARANAIATRLESTLHTVVKNPPRWKWDIALAQQGV